MPATDRSRLRKKQEMFQRHTAYLAGKTPTKKKQEGEEEESQISPEQQQQDKEQDLSKDAIDTSKEAMVETMDAVEPPPGGEAEEPQSSTPTSSEVEMQGMATTIQPLISDNNTERDPPAPTKHEDLSPMNMSEDVMSQQEDPEKEKGHGFDMRSIDEHPPEPMQRLGEASEDDPSWNPHIPLAFDKDSAEHANNTSAMNSHMAPSFSEDAEEKKESSSPSVLFPDNADWAIEESAALAMDKAESSHIPSNAGREEEDALLVTRSADTEEEESKDDNEDDEDPLLVARATSGDNDNYYVKNNQSQSQSPPVMSMEERVKMYNDASNFPRDSSSSEDEEEDEQSAGEEESVDAEVEYIEKGSDEEDDDESDGDNDAYFSPDKLDDESSPAFSPNHDLENGGEIPVFDPSNLLAVESCNTVSTDDEDVLRNARQPVKLEGLEMIDESSSVQLSARNETLVINNTGSGSVNSSSLIGGNLLTGAGAGDSVTTASGGSSTNWVGSSTNKPPHRPGIPMPPPPPPPPPPPADKKKKKRNSNRSQSTSNGEASGSSNIPLIKPPPEEKIKAWEERQTRAQKHLAALKISTDDDHRSVQNSGTEADGAGAPNEEVVKETQPIASSPVEMARAMAIQNALKRAQESSQQDTLKEQSSRQEMFVSSPSKTKKSVETAMSPTSAVSDQKMAEKIAMASSAAAHKFEESYNSASEQKQDDNEKPGNGAISHLFPGGTDKLPSKTVSEESTTEFSRDALGAVEYVAATNDGEEGQEYTPSLIEKENGDDRFAWFCSEVLEIDPVPDHLTTSDSTSAALRLLEEDSNFNRMCEFIADCVNKTPKDLDQMASFDEITATSSAAEIMTIKTAESNIESQLDTAEGEKPRLKPMVLSDESKTLAPKVLAANFVSFLFIAAKGSQVDSPFGENNPFLLDIVTMQLRKAQNSSEVDDNASEPNGIPKTMQQALFEHPEFSPDALISFVHTVYSVNRQEEINQLKTVIGNFGRQEEDMTSRKTPRVRGSRTQNRNLIVPEGHPSPFEASVWNTPSILAHVLGMLGDPVAVCRMKMVNRFCKRLVSEHEHVLMRDAVRAGGLSMNVRPAFWIWISLQKCQDSSLHSAETECDLKELEQRGRDGKWHQVIDRDVARSFGNMPPHKTGARLRTDSIVRALVTWGKNRIMKRGVKGGGDVADAPSMLSKEEKARWRSRRATTSVPPWSCGGDGNDDDSVKSEISQTPTDTVSDWGAVSPVGSFAGSVTGGDARVRLGGLGKTVEAEELALSGNFLTPEMKVVVQGKLSYILHSLAAAHPDVGYCQGMDYVVAHLLRILQDTIRWKALNGTLPEAIKSTSTLPDLARLSLEMPRKINETIDSSLVVEETIFKMMDVFFTTYNLRHMYWPELRYLKICCRVFERLIQIKLPVLADHFEHHELNIGLFALGWFQTLFLYLPSMPSATVCHMWDIWMVERSFKIFFRVGTAILFLSQPILLNHELEGMMTYLNTIPDATLLNPDILIACALNIKVTNKMLEELEAEVVGE